MLPESVSACKVLRSQQRTKHPSRQRIKHPSRQRIKHLSRHPFHANPWMACIAPHGQNQRVPATLIDDMCLIAQERRVYKAREMDYGEREAKETLPIKICWKIPDSSLPSKLVSHDKGGRDVWPRTYSRLSPFSKSAMHACMHDVGRVDTRPFHTHVM